MCPGSHLLASHLRRQRPAQGPSFSPALATGLVIMRRSSLHERNVHTVTWHSLGPGISRNSMAWSVGLLLLRHRAQCERSRVDMHISVSVHVLQRSHGCEPPIPLTVAAICWMVSVTQKQVFQ